MPIRADEALYEVALLSQELLFHRCNPSRSPRSSESRAPRKFQKWQRTLSNYLHDRAGVDPTCECAAPSCFLVTLPLRAFSCYRFSGAPGSTVFAISWFASKPGRNLQTQISRRWTADVGIASAISKPSACDCFKRRQFQSKAEDDRLLPWTRLPRPCAPSRSQRNHRRLNTLAGGELSQPEAVRLFHPLLQDGISIPYEELAQISVPASADIGQYVLATVERSPGATPNQAANPRPFSWRWLGAFVDSPRRNMNLPPDRRLLPSIRAQLANNSDSIQVIVLVVLRAFHGDLGSESLVCHLIHVDPLRDRCRTFHGPAFI